jgi:hypothetical protein
MEGSMNHVSFPDGYILNRGHVNARRANNKSSATSSQLSVHSVNTLEKLDKY